MNPPILFPNPFYYMCIFYIFGDGCFVKTSVRSYLMVRNQSFPKGS